jgi:hypothetical protein
MKTGRINSGRKALPPEQKKKQISIYIEPRIVDSFGGAEQYRQWLTDITESEYRKKENRK